MSQIFELPAQLSALKLIFNPPNQTGMFLKILPRCPITGFVECFFKIIKSAERLLSVFELNKFKKTCIIGGKINISVGSAAGQIRKLK